METRTFRAETMVAALEQVQQELGPDALVISARNVPGGAAWQVWRQPGVEIVAAAPERNAPGEAQPKPPAPRQQPDAASSPTPARREQPWQPRQYTRSKLAGDSLVENPVQASKAAPEATAAAERLAAALAAKMKPAANPAPTPSEPAAGEQADSLPSGLRPLQQMLLDQEIEPAWVKRVLSLAAETLPTGLARDGEVCRTFLRRQMEAELQSAPPDPTIPPQRVICLAGPSGSGKTSLLARLARQYASNPRAVIQWVCADTQRLSAIAEARAYTQALNLPLSLVYTRADWDEVLNGPANLVLVDTPGINPWDERELTELGDLLPPVSARLLYLAVSANTKLKDALQAASMLKIFGLHGLAATHLDETRSYGTLFDLARKSRLPLAVFTSSKQLTRGLELARSSRLVDALLGKEWK